MIQSLGIRQRIHVLDLAPMHDVAHGELDDLTALGARDVRYLDDPGRHVPWSRIAADLYLDAVTLRPVRPPPASASSSAAGQDLGDAEAKIVEAAAGLFPSAKRRTAVPGRAAPAAAAAVLRIRSIL